MRRNAGTILEVVVAKDDAQGGALSVLRRVEFAGRLEPLNGALIVFFLEGSPADPEVRLRGGGGFRVGLKQLAKRSGHPLVVLLLTEDERLLLEGEFAFRTPPDRCQ